MKNRTILQYNGDKNRNTAFLSEETQNAIHDACEKAKTFGADFEYEIRNDYNTAGIFAYTVNGRKTETLCYSPIVENEQTFLCIIQSILFDILIGQRKRTVYLIKSEFRRDGEEEESVLPYATRELAEQAIKGMIDNAVNLHIKNGTLVNRDGNIEFDWMDSNCEVQISPTHLFLDDGWGFHDAIWIEEQELITKVK